MKTFTISVLNGSEWIHDSLFNNKWSHHLKLVKVVVIVYHVLVLSNFNLVLFLGIIQLNIANEWSSKSELIKRILLFIFDCSSVVKFRDLFLKVCFLMFHTLEVVLKNFFKVVVLSKSRFLVQIHLGGTLWHELLFIAIGIGIEEAHLLLAHLSVKMRYVLWLIGTHVN